VNNSDTSTTTNFELVIIFLHHFSQPVCVVTSLWRNNDHISSAVRKKNNNPKSPMRVRTFQPHWYGVRRCIAHGLCMQKSFSFNQSEN